jgi:hypothetical protein
LFVSTDIKIFAMFPKNAGTEGKFPVYNVSGSSLTVLIGW